MDIEQIVAAAQHGDVNARDHMGGWLSDMLRRYLCRWFPTHEADELTQQTCVVVLEHLHAFEARGPGSFARWVRTIARLRMKKAWAAPGREAAKLDRFAHHPPKSTLSLTTRVTLLELEQQLGEAFAQLSEIEQDAILWGYEERDDRELAKLHAVAVQTIHTHRHRGYKRLAARTKAARKRPLPRLLPRARPSSSASASSR